MVPSAITEAGGEITHFGMPVDPGNLLAIGRIGRTRIIILPGCARSPKENGFDWVLERLAASLEVKSEDVQAMGVGGLLKETARGQPRLAGEMPARPRFAGILLAAGLSRRMGKNKLLESAARQASRAPCRRGFRRGGAGAPRRRCPGTTAMQLERAPDGLGSKSFVHPIMPKA